MVDEQQTKSDSPQESKLQTPADRPPGKDNPTWSLVIWGGATVVLVVYGVLCVIDGWFRPDYEHADFNRVAAPVCLVAAVWCIWRGTKEYKSLKARAAGQGAPETTATSSEAPPALERGDGPGKSSQDKSAP